MRSTGFNSPMFIRTVKLKDFPWNGWLALGHRRAPERRLEPDRGFTDDFGRLMWSAVGDPALIPSPYESAWMLNRVSDVQVERDDNEARIVHSVIQDLCLAAYECFCTHFAALAPGLARTGAKADE